MAERKSLFDADERYTTEAVKLSSEAALALDKLFYLADRGFSTREIACIIREALVDIELSRRL